MLYNRSDEIKVWVPIYLSIVFFGCCCCCLQRSGYNSLQHGTLFAKYKIWISLKIKCTYIPTYKICAYSIRVVGMLQMFSRKPDNIYGMILEKYQNIYFNKFVLALGVMFWCWGVYLLMCKYYYLVQNHSLKN